MRGSIRDAHCVGYAAYNAAITLLQSMAISASTTANVENTGITMAVVSQDLTLLGVERQNRYVAGVMLNDDEHDCTSTRFQTHDLNWEARRCRGRQPTSVIS